MQRVVGTAAALLGAGTLALVGGSSAAAGRVDLRSALENPTHADIVFENVTLWSFRGSRLAAHGTGARVTYDRQGGHGWVVAPDAFVLPATGTGIVDHVTATTGTGTLTTKVADALGHVTLDRADGSARTESAHYEGAAHRITGRDPIEVVTRRFTMHGTAFEADTSTEVADFEGPVTGDGQVHR